MIVFANAKINIGLQVISRRADGYHNLETVFYPLKLYDAVEVVEAKEVKFFSSGLPLEVSEEDNLCLRAYRLLAEQFKLPPVHIYLHKVIPMGAGLGGGSADAAFMLKLLDKLFELELQESDLMNYARRLGADCAFFIRNNPVLATGIGDVFEDIPVDLSAYHLAVVKPDVHISTAEAYRMVSPHSTGKQLRATIQRPIDTWRDTIFNDFEAGVFAKYPEVESIKAMLYEQGAVFAAMSGSGSAIYGVFRERVELPELESRHQVFYIH